MGGTKGAETSAVELAAARFGFLVADSALQAATPGAVVSRAIDTLAGILTDSDFHLGCPVSVVTWRWARRASDCGRPARTPSSRGSRR